MCLRIPLRRRSVRGKMCDVKRRWRKRKRRTKRECGVCVGAHTSASRFSKDFSLSLSLSLSLCVCVCVCVKEEEGRRSNTNAEHSSDSDCVCRRQLSASNTVSRTHHKVGGNS